MTQFAVFKKGDFIYDPKKCALHITPSINLALAFAKKCDFETDITTINI